MRLKSDLCLAQAFTPGSAGCDKLIVFLPLQGRSRSEKSPEGAKKLSFGHPHGKCERPGSQAAPKGLNSIAPCNASLCNTPFILQNGSGEVVARKAFSDSGLCPGTCAQTSVVHWRGCCTSHILEDTEVPHYCRRRVGPVGLWDLPGGGPAVGQCELQESANP